MIVWFNCKITDVRLHTQFNHRYKLRNDNRFDIARYSFASFAPLSPLVSKFIFNLEMADAYAGREPDMEDWIRSVLPEDKLEFNWFRCDDLSQWQDLHRKITQIDDDLIFPAGNEDHIFLDKDLELFKKGLELLSSDPDPLATLTTSHYPEGIRAAYHFNGEPSPCGQYVSFYTDNNDAIRVIKRDLFDWYLSTFPRHIGPVFRTEHWNSVGLPRNKLYVPTKEQFRHLDGYQHVNIGPEYTPPLEVPPGFFDGGITIRYGFSDRDPNCVNINPMTETLYAEDGIGTDYKFTLRDIPAFWMPRIKEIIVAPNVNDQEMAEARDINMLLMTRLPFNWPHMGVTFGNLNFPPADWVNQHMLVSRFV